MGFALPWKARANDMDVALSRLRISTDPAVTPNLPEGCLRVSDQGVPRDFCPDNDSWKRLMSQYGMALAPPMLTPARTTGWSGFAMGFEGWITGISERADYWEKGTEGDARSALETPPHNGIVQPVVFGWRLAMRKGLPFGFEVGASFGGASNSSLWMWGAELKWALFEGFRTGVGWLPDAAIRASVHVVTGDPDFTMAIPAVDLVISKPIVIGSKATLSPFLSGQVLWLIARSELIDLTPDVDAIAECQPSTDPITPSSASAITCPPRPAGADPLPNGRVPGQDLNNNAVFSDIHATRARMTLGIQGRYRIFTLSGAFSFDLVKPRSADSDVPSDLPRQWSFAFGSGLQF